MSSDRATLAVRSGFSAATLVLVLAGASMNNSGRVGALALIAGIAGLLALAAGSLNTVWKASIPLGLAALIGALFAAQFNLKDRQLPWELAGLLLLGLGGVVGSIAYRSFTDVLHRQSEDIGRLNGQLEEKHRAFMAATSDADAGGPPGDVAALTANIAGQIGSAFACYYLTSPDGKQFVPQPPGIGLDRLHPQPVNRMHEGAGQLVSAIESGKLFVGTDKNGLTELVNYLPDVMHVESRMAVPMPIGEHIGGFVLLGNKPGGFSDDDSRLARTLTLRAGAQLANAHAVALSRKELARYSLMNELVKEAAGKTMDEVLELVLDKGKQLIRYDAGTVALFGPGDTYVIMGSSEAPKPIEGPLTKVLDGETVIRSLITEEEGLFSGLHPSNSGGTANEALTPIRGKDGIMGAICLGRNGTSGFNQRDVTALDELGSMAGIAVENS